MFEFEFELFVIVIVIVIEDCSVPCHVPSSMYMELYTSYVIASSYLLLVLDSPGACMYGRT